MSEDNETRTAAEECICAVLAEAYYIDGGTPKEFREMMEKDPVLKRMYNKIPYMFKGGRSKAEAAFHENDDMY